MRVVLGALAGALLGIGWAWTGSGPDHYEWLDAAVVMGILGAALGAGATALVMRFRG